MKIRQIHLGFMIILLLFLALNPITVKASYSHQISITKTIPAVNPTAETPTIDLPVEIAPSETPVVIAATPTPTEGVEFPTPTAAVTKEPALTDELENNETIGGTEFIEVIIDSPPHPPAGFEESAVQLPEPNITAGINTLSVPAYDWVYGCSAVSGAMIAAYYDRNGFPNLYTGPTNGGVAPMDSSSWGSFTDNNSATYPLNPIIASRDGLDGRIGRGSIDDYWDYFGSLTDPFTINGWNQHTWSTIGDYMKTSQAAYNNSDGSSVWYYSYSNEKATCAELESSGYVRDLNLGRSQFYTAMGYTVDECYNQRTDNKVSGGFSFNDFKTQIDNGHPVMIQVVGHTMVGVGYDDSTNTIYIHDTWDYNTHSMTWGGSYSGRELLGVSIATLLSPPGTPTLISPSGTATSRTPQYVWYVTPNASSYWMTIARASDGAYLYNSTVTPSCNEVTCWVTPSVSLADGEYWYKVTAGNAAGWGAASASLSFSVQTPDPPQLISPNGTITTHTPQFVWYVSPGATKYWMTVAQSNGAYVYNSYITPSCNGYTCWITPQLNLPDGDYWYKVTAGNAVGWGSASSQMNFTVDADQPPAAPTLISPNGTVTSGSPLFVWYATASATSYWMTVARSSDGAYLYNSYITPSCNGYTCWITPSLNLTNASYWFKITAGNAAGWGSASSQMNFTVSLDVPAAPTLIAPSGTVSTNSPLFVWYATANATSYWLTVARSSDGAYLFNSYVTPNTNGYTCWMNLPGSLANGDYFYKITAGNSAGWGSASSPMNFAVAVSSSPPPEIQPDRAVPLLK